MNVRELFSNISDHFLKIEHYVKCWNRTQEARAETERGKRIIKGTKRGNSGKTLTAWNGEGWAASGIWSSEYGIKVRS